MPNSTPQTETLYRYRAWDKNTWYADDAISAEEIAKGWGDWEFIDEQKYNEICAYIAWDNPCHYQAQKLEVAVVENTSFDPAAWITAQNKRIEEARVERYMQHCHGRMD